MNMREFLVTQRNLHMQTQPSGKILIGHVPSSLSKATITLFGASLFLPSSPAPNGEGGEGEERSTEDEATKYYRVP